MTHFTKSTLALLTATLALAACQSGDGSTVLRVAASAMPHEQILEQVRPHLKEAGIALKVVPVNDYVQPNLRLAQGDIDANYYQTVTYLQFFNQERNLTLCDMAAVHLEPFGLYSKRHKSLDALPMGATVAIPSDVSNGNRALALLQAAHLIKHDASRGHAAGVKDILENPRKLRFKQAEAAMMPRILDDVDVAGINANFALPLGLIAAKDALAAESISSPYGNVLAVRQGDQGRNELQALAQALRSERIKQYITDTYEGAVLPAF